MGSCTWWGSSKMRYPILFRGLGVMSISSSVVAKLWQGGLLASKLIWPPLPKETAGSTKVREYHGP